MAITAERAKSRAKSRLDLVEDIIELIVTGQVKELTSENELAHKIGLDGRTPALREALALLSRDGIVLPRPQRGYEVPSISLDEAKEIVELRAETQKLVVRKL